MEIDFVGAFVEIVQKMTPDMQSMYDEAKVHTLDDWETQQKAFVTTSGIGSGLIPVPGLHLPAAFADLAFVVNRMGVTAYGIGAIEMYDEDFGNILEEEDFVGVLGYWAGDEEFKHSFKVKGSSAALKVAAKVGGKAGAKIVTKSVMASLGYLVASRAGLKSVAKTAPPLVHAATMIGTKAGVKVGGAWIPVAGSLLSGGINYWLISSISTAAIEFYNDKLNIIAEVEDA